MMIYFWTIFFGTFVLEDVALAGALVLVAQGQLSLTVAFAACFFGICLGDLGLYFIGYGISRLERAKNFSFFKKYEADFAKMKKSPLLPYSIVISRVLPGTRLPTYLGAGFLRYSLLNFTLLTSVSVFVWVLAAFALGHSLAPWLRGNWLLTLVTLLALLFIFKSLAPKLVDPWQRKAFWHSWRKWTHFEFWPSWFFYLPIIPYYIYRSLRGGSFLLPFYANPQLLNGGLIGESKWDFLKHLPASDPGTLKSVFLEGNLSVSEASEKIQNDFSYPFILKPDVGQRGYGVRIIKSSGDLQQYLEITRGLALVAQKFSQYPREAGIFYYRNPLSSRGEIFSITDKEFPFLKADGERTLGDLILADTRARIIAPVYFSRHQESLGRIFPKDEVIFLSECGNHCQGAIFKNGKNLITPLLVERIEKIARDIPDFYFGRIDIRYESIEALRQGTHFEILEVNGAGSEATHIWDPRTTLLEAYGVLFQQWTLLFAIGAEIKKQKRNPNNVKVGSFLKESLRVYRRQDKLTTSS